MPSKAAGCGKVWIKNGRIYLRVDDIEKYYGSGTNVTKHRESAFRVKKGEFVGVLGLPVGKDIAFKPLATIDQVTAGHIYYETTDITELSEEEIVGVSQGQPGICVSGV